MSNNRNTYGTGEYMKSERKRRNDRSSTRADHFRENWDEAEVELLLTWDRTESELTEMAEILGRTREACRDRYYSTIRARQTGPVQIFTRTTTTTERWDYGRWSDGDEYSQGWYR